MRDQTTRTDRLVRILQRVTQARGATEHEALAAAGRVAVLLARYDGHALTEQVYVVRSRAWFRSRGASGRTGRVPVTRHALPGISATCGVVHYWTPLDGTLSFFGTEAAVRAAHDIVDMLASAIAAAYARYSREVPRLATESGAARSKQYRVAMAARINERLTRADSTRADHVRREFETAYAVKSGTQIATPSVARASVAGYGAGDRVVLPRGVAAPVAEILGAPDD